MTSGFRKAERKEHTAKDLGSLRANPRLSSPHFLALSTQPAAQAGLSKGEHKQEHEWPQLPHL